MGNNMKSASIEMREFIKRMRGGDISQKSNDSTGISRNMTIRDMLKITRLLNEDNNRINKKTPYDQKYEEQKFLDMFRDLNIVVDFIELEIYDDYVFWGGTIDGIIQFVYKVTKNELTSGVEFNYLKGFSPDNTENDEIIKRVEAYFDMFYKYWRDNIIQK